MKELTIDLISPITTHDGQVTQIVLREPRARDFFALGEPYTWTHPDGGKPIPIAIPEVILGYIERCMVRPNAEFLAQVSLADAFKLEEAVSDFFGAARRAAYPTPATSSSSTSGSSPQPSAEA